MDSGHILNTAVEYKQQLDGIILEFRRFIAPLSMKLDGVQRVVKNPTFLSNVSPCKPLSEPSEKVVDLAHEWFGLNTHPSLDIISHTVVNRKEGLE